ncbi:MAG: hypothetical protein M1820_005322 [Bogoriella megaspora]|nr:MAG: hypothetical protein M1820_005322 [Bogoriella megaspora]
MAHTSTILVTGGTTGLGYYCALEIAKQSPNALVIIASRSSADDAAGKINQTLNQSNVQYLPLDLSSLSNVRDFASDFINSDRPPLTALVLNAGLQFPGGVEYSPDGFEKTFAINHLGHALLFYLLRPKLTPSARIVLTTSGTHDPAQKTGIHAQFTTAADAAHPSTELAKRGGRDRYGDSKLCNVLWTYALARHIKTARLSYTVTVMDPGLMPGTGLSRDAGPVVKFLFNRVLPHLIPVLRLAFGPNVHRPGESGAALARLAVGSDVAGVSGEYYEGMKTIRSSETSYDQEKQEDLWEWTARNIARDENEVAAFKDLRDL